MDEVDRLIEQLKDADPDVRLEILRKLERIGKPAVPALLEVLDKGDRRLWDVAIEALGWIKDASVVPFLIDGLKNWGSDPDISTSISSTLIKIGEPAVLPLIEALGSADGDAQESAAFALCKIKDARAIPALIGVLEDVQNPNVLFWAAQALGKAGDERAIPALIEVLKNENPDVRMEAAKALVLFAPVADIELSKVAESLHAYVKHMRETGSIEEKERARRWVVETYRKIADAVVERKRSEMPGEMLEGKIRPPKKGIYRMRRAVV